MFIRRFLFICICSVFIAVASGTCYWIDGTEATDRVTCSDLSTVGASMCCDKTSSAFFDSCTDGICAYTYASGVQGRYDDGLSFWRDACSDPTWQDPACVHMASYVTSSQVRLSKCADGSFCPRNTDDLNTTCCENHQGEYARNTSAAISANLTTANSELATSGSSSHSSSASTTSNPEAAKSTALSYSSSTSITENTGVATSTSLSKSPQGAGDGLERGSEIATIAGSVVGALAFILTLVFSIHKWRKRRNQARLSGSNVNTSQQAIRAAF